VSDTRVAVSAEITLHSLDTLFCIYSIKAISILDICGNEFYFKSVQSAVDKKFVLIDFLTTISKESDIIRRIRNKRK